MVNVAKVASGAVFSTFALGLVLCSLAVVAQTSPPQAESLQQKVQQDGDGHYYGNLVGELCPSVEATAFPGPTKATSGQL